MEASHQRSNSERDNRDRDLAHRIAGNCMTLVLDACNKISMDSSGMGMDSPLK